MRRAPTNRYRDLPTYESETTQALAEVRMIQPLAIYKRVIVVFSVIHYCVHILV